MESGGTTILDFALLHPGYKIHARSKRKHGSKRRVRTAHADEA